MACRREAQSSASSPTRFTPALSPTIQISRRLHLFRQYGHGAAVPLYREQHGSDVSGGTPPLQATGSKLQWGSDDSVDPSEQFSELIFFGAQVPADIQSALRGRRHHLFERHERPDFADLRGVAQPLRNVVSPADLSRNGHGHHHDDEQSRRGPCSGRRLHQYLRQRQQYLRQLNRGIRRLARRNRRHRRSSWGKSSATRNSSSPTPRLRRFRRTCSIRVAPRV